MKKGSKWLSNMKFVLVNVLRQDRALIGNYVFFTLASVCFPFVPLYLMRYTVDRFTRGAGGFTVWVLLAFLAAGLFLQLMTIVTNANIEKKNSAIGLFFTGRLLEKSVALPYSEMRKPEVLSRLEKSQALTRMFGAGVGVMIKSAFHIFQNAVSTVGCIVILTKAGPLLPFAAFILLSAGYFFRYQALLAEHAQSDTMSDIMRKTYTYAQIAQDVQYGKEVRVYKLAGFLRMKFSEYSLKFIELYARVHRGHLKGELIDSCFLGIVIIGAYLTIIRGYLSGGVELADVAMLIATTTTMNMSMKELMRNLGDVLIKSRYVTDLIDFLDYSPQSVPQAEAGAILPAGPYSVEFRNISFRYPGDGRYIFKDFSFKAEAGERLAIVGPNGAGKTTLAHILCRLYDVEKGDVLINGVSIYSIPVRSYWSVFSCVSQQSGFLSYSILDNITAGDADSGRFDDALRKAEMSDRISSLANGADTVYSREYDDQGVVFSGGEIQRLALARALYKNGNVVIFDEPTANLDPLAEQNMYYRIHEMIEEKKLIFFISHRLASTRFCDRIIFMEDGKIVEAGTHDELVGRNGRYAYFFSVQAREYREGGDTI